MDNHTTLNEVDLLWLNYEKTKDQASKNRLIVKYAPLVKYTAGRLSAHIGAHVEFDDLISYGIFGLMDAIEKFDYTKGVKFETYAVIRIRGEMIDCIRKLDWVPRSLRQKNKMLEQAYSQLENELDRPPTDDEIASKLHMTTESAKDLIKKASVISLVSLEDYLDESRETKMQNTQNSNDQNPEMEYEKYEIKQMLANAIEKLNEKEQKLISLYYYDDLTLKEISEVLEISESRASQIHAKAVLKLQGTLGKYKSVLFTV